METPNHRNTRRKKVPTGSASVEPYIMDGCGVDVWMRGVVSE
jgi:hypothetical protein